MDVEAVQEGFSSKPSPLYDELLRRDSLPVEYSLRTEGRYRSKVAPVAANRYFDPEFALQEREAIWKRCWQVVGREEDIPQVGDRKSYDVGKLSYIIIRSGENEFRALENSCRHRGMRLCSGLSGGNVIRCPYHSWEWNVDGSLRKVPGAWDFPHVSAETHSLNEAQVARWGGFLFINPDLQAGPLTDALGILADHFREEDAERRYTMLWIRKKVRANWKVNIEAFLEAYHVVGTHPQLVASWGDAASKYDIWDDGKSHVSRGITPGGVPSPYLGEDASATEAAAALLQDQGFDPSDFPALSSPETARADVAAWRRKVLGASFGVDFTSASDSYMLDPAQYFMFPNFTPWISGTPSLFYQFMPFQDDPNSSVIEVRVLTPYGPGEAAPPCAEPIDVDFDERLTDFPQINVFFSQTFDQDFDNMPMVQQGLQSRLSEDSAMTLGRYQEIRIQHFHETIDKKIAGLAARV